MFDLRLDGPSDPKPSNPAARRRRRDRESILVTRGDEDAGPVNLLGTGHVPSASHASFSSESAPKNEAKTEAEENNGFYTAVKWQPLKFGGSNANAPTSSNDTASAPPLARAKTSPLASVAASSRINRDPLALANQVGKLGLRSRIPKVASEPQPATKTLHTLRTRTIEKQSEPEQPATPPSTEHLVVVEQSSEASVPVATPSPVKEVKEAAVATPTTPLAELVLPPTVSNARDPDDVYGFASFQDAFVTEGELEAAKEKLGEEEANALADPWAKLTKWTVQEGENGFEAEETVVISERVTISCSFMTFGIGRLVADRTHVSWNGHRLVDPKTKQQPQTTTATILKIPLDKMLNLRLRPRSEEDDPAFRENMILTEVEEASVQFAVGKDDERAISCLAKLKELASPKPATPVAPSAPQPAASELAKVQSTPRTPARLPDETMSPGGFKLPVLSPAFSNSSPASFTSARTPTVNSTNNGRLAASKPSSHGTPTPLVPSRTIEVAVASPEEGLWGPLDLSPSSRDGGRGGRVFMLQDLTLDPDTIGTLLQSKAAAPPEAATVEAFESEQDVVTEEADEEQSAPSPTASVPEPQPESPPAVEEVDPIATIDAHFERLLLDAQARRDAAIREAEFVYEQELRALVEEKERMLIEEEMARLGKWPMDCSAEAEVVPAVLEEEVLVEDEVEDPLCGLCYDAPRTKVLRPCNHTVCELCLERLGIGQTENFKCPWDRFDVAIVEDL